METTFRRAKLSLLAAVRIGSHGMLQKPVRLLIVLFLTAVALILFGLSVTVAMYDEDRAIAESMVLYDRAALVMKPDESPFSKEELALLEEKTGKAFGSLSPAPQELLPDLMLFSAGSYPSPEELKGCLRRSPFSFCRALGSGARRGGRLFPHGAAARKEGGDRSPRLLGKDVYRPQLLRRDRKPAGVS